MTDCNLHIVYEDGDSTFNAGDTISGRISVQVNEECTCNALETTLFWQTSGRGEEASEEVLTTNILPESTRWMPGKTYEYEFEIPTPNGPCSYDGKDLNVEWFMRVDADVPWGFDPGTEQPFTLKPGPVEEFNTGSYEISTSDFQDFSLGKMIGKSIAIFVGLLFMYFPLNSMYAHAIGGEEYENLKALYILGSLSILFGGVLVFYFLQNVLSEWKLGDVQATLPPCTSVPVPNCRSKFSFNREAKPKSMKLTLR